MYSRFDLVSKKLLFSVTARKECLLWRKYKSLVLLGSLQKTKPALRRVSEINFDSLLLYRLNAEVCGIA